MKPNVGAQGVSIVQYRDTLGPTKIWKPYIYREPQEI